MLLRVSVDNLVDAVFEAVDLAGQGEIAEGYRVLLRGRQAALEGEQNFEPWAEEMEGRWDAAINGGRASVPVPHSRFWVAYGVGASRAAASIVKASRSECGWRS